MPVLYDHLVERTFSCLAVIEQHEGEQTFHAQIAILRKGTHIPIPLLDQQLPSYEEAKAAVDRALGSE